MSSISSLTYVKAALPVALSALVGFCWKPLMAFSLAHFYFSLVFSLQSAANVQSPYKPGPEPCLLPCLCNTAEPEINYQFSERFSQLLPGPHIPTRNPFLFSFLFPPPSFHCHLSLRRCLLLPRTLPFVMLLPIISSALLFLSFSLLFLILKPIIPFLCPYKFI